MHAKAMMLALGVVMGSFGCQPRATDTTTDTAATDTAATDTAVTDTSDDTGNDDTDDGSDTDDTDACDPDGCAVLDCAPAHQETEDGACCPVCVEPPPECADAADCEGCAYPTAPQTADDCYCVGCATTPMPADECTTNRDAWNAVCPDTPGQAECPVFICMPGAPPICDDGTCAVDAEACSFNDDCALCEHPNTPTSEAECQCPDCGTPMLKSQCDANQEAVWDHCIDAHDACPMVDCVEQPAVVCDRGATWRCVFDTD